MDETARFALPQLAPGQAQKEWWHNEALQRIDLLLCPAVASTEIATPPASPAVGACYLVAAGATGAWAGMDGALAGYCEGGWRFIAPTDGMRLLDLSNGQVVMRRDSAWESGISRAREYQVDGETVIRARQPSIAGPLGGSVVDAESRMAIAAILNALRTHGLIA